MQIDGQTLMPIGEPWPLLCQPFQQAAWTRRYMCGLRKMVIIILPASRASNYCFKATLAPDTKHKLPIQLRPDQREIPVRSRKGS